MNNHRTVDNKCPLCGTNEKEYEIEGDVFYYCPKCKKEPPFLTLTQHNKVWSNTCND